MSDIPLRARSAVEIVDAAFQVYRRQALTFIMVTALAYAPWLVVQLLIFRSANVGPAGAATTADAADAVRTFVLIIGSFITFSLMSGVLTKLGAETYLGSGSGRVEDAVRDVLPRVPALIGAAIGRTLLVGLGFMLLFIPGIILFAMYAAINPLIVLERKGAGESFVRSAQLTRGQRWHVLGTYLLIGLIYVLLFFGMTFIMTLLRGSFVLQQVLLTATVVVLYPVVGLTEMLLYYDLRVRNEGYDVEVMAGSLGERPVTS